MTQSSTGNRAGSQLAYDAIKKAIFLQRLEPGSPLTERALCESLHMGRSPIRKALQQLAEDNIVELLPNRGARVAHFTKTEVIHLFDVKNALEKYALRLSISKYTKEDLDNLRSYINAESVAAEADDIVEYLRAVAQFHNYIADKVGNPYLSEIYHDLSNKLTVYLVLYDHFYSVGKHLKSIPLHTKVVDAIEQGKSALAERALDRMAEAVIESYDYYPARYAARRCSADIL